MKIAIASGKGGTGKTFVATNLYRSLQKRAQSVTLVDADVEVPNDSLFFNTVCKKNNTIKELKPTVDPDKCTYCGKCAEYCNYQAIFCIPSKGVIKMLHEWCHSCGACLYACPEGAMLATQEEIGEVNFNQEIREKHLLVEGRMRVTNNTAIPVIKAAIEQAEEIASDIYLVDAPPGTSCPFIKTAELSDYIIMVSEPTPFALNDLKLSLDTLDTLNKPYGVIINKADIGDGTMRNYLQQRGVTIIDELPYSTEWAQYYAKGLIAVEHSRGAEQHFERCTDFIINRNLKEKEA